MISPLAGPKSSTGACNGACCGAGTNCSLNYQPNPNPEFLCCELQNTFASAVSSRTLLRLTVFPNGCLCASHVMKYLSVGVVRMPSPRAHAILMKAAYELCLCGKADDLALVITVQLDAGTSLFSDT